jgi:hypothetical protein
MKYIPHDYYLKFMSSTVHAETLDFHAKGNYTIHDAFKHATRLHNVSDEQLTQLTGNELRFYPDLNLEFPVHSELNLGSDVCRDESCETFSSTNVVFSKLEKLISPVLSSRKDSYKRGYPSGGALYPVEMFICSLMDDEESWPCPEKILHLLPRSKRFEVMQGTQNIDDVKRAILSSPGSIGTPRIAIVYAVYIPKETLKKTS